MPMRPFPRPCLSRAAGSLGPAPAHEDAKAPDVPAVSLIDADSKRAALPPGVAA
jgi:hypothetical protein